jgi:alpha-galactosidase
MKTFAQTTAILFLLAQAPFAHAVSVSADEMAEARQWAAARFEGAQEARKTEPALLVLANHDAVQRNGRSGKPLRIVQTEYTHGLFCHAFSKIIVRLPGPGQSFTATVGVDSNEQTSGGRGSVDFSVSVGGQEKFRSGVMREGMAGKPVRVDLGGANEFVIHVDETPDGIACDQADWADAKAALQDGREVWLADLPLTETTQRRLFSVGPPFSFVFDGQPSSELLKHWKLERASRQLAGVGSPSPEAARGKTEHTLTWTDPASGLQLHCVALEYHDFPTVEWTLYFKNTGTNATPILERIPQLLT